VFKVPELKIAPTTRNSLFEFCILRAIPVDIFLRGRQLNVNIYDWWSPSRGFRLSFMVVVMVVVVHVNMDMNICSSRACGRWVYIRRL